MLPVPLPGPAVDEATMARSRKALEAFGSGVPEVGVTEFERIVPLLRMVVVWLDPATVVS